jgi:DNA-binding NarL/FixJ family response regulator
MIIPPLLGGRPVVRDLLQMGRCPFSDIHPVQRGNNNVKSYSMSPLPAEATAGQAYQPRPAEPLSFRMERERPKPNLTEREKEVLRLVCDGMTNAEIATKLHVSRETVKSELKRIFRKIGVGNRTQAAVLLVKNHWL